MYGVRCTTVCNFGNIIICRQMDSEEMKRRTKMFAINVARLTQKLPDNAINRVYKGQIIRS